MVSEHFRASDIRDANVSFAQQICTVLRYNMHDIDLLLLPPHYRKWRYNMAGIALARTPRVNTPNIELRASAIVHAQASLHSTSTT